MTHRTQAFVPTILQPLPSALDFLSHLLREDDESSPDSLTVLVICTSREAFHRHLSQASAAGADIGSDPTSPTLRNLSISRGVEIRYVTSVLAFHALLSALAQDYEPSKAASEHSEHHGTCGTLGILNMVALHEATPAFSAQGLSRAFATVTSTGRAMEARIVIGETSIKDREDDEVLHDEQMQIEMGEEHVTQSGGSEQLQEGNERTRQSKDIWSLAVPILNATTKSFGPGERGWLGRTVTIRRIAERWCRFACP